MKKLLDRLTQAAWLAFSPLAFFRLAFFGLAFLLAGCGEIINVYTTSAERPALELEVGSGGEWTEAIAFTAILAEATTKDVTFSYATELDGTADEDDLVPVTGKATIRAGETEVSIIVQVIDDSQDDNDETFSFVLSQANTELINGEDSITATATILDDDYGHTPLKLAQFDDVSIKEGDGYIVNSVVFNVILNRSVLAHENVSFDYIVIGETAQDNEDYISIVGTADISLSDRISLSVEIVGDYVAEERFETFNLVISNPVGFEIVEIDEVPESDETPESNGIAESDEVPEVDGIAVGTIIDNDKLVIESFRNVFRVEGNANQNFVFDVVFSRPVLADEVVSLKYTVIQGTAQAGSDYIAVPATTWYFDDSSDGDTIVVEIIGDEDDEDDYESFTVELSELVGISTIPAVDLIATGTIQDDDGGQGLLKDVDGDGLIDIYDAYMLDKIRYDLKGTSYKISESAPGIARGCPNTGCFGYELVDDIQLPPTEWVPVGTSEFFKAFYYYWVPKGSYTKSFNATFEGNGFSITNLNIVGNDELDNVGFFGTLGKTAKVLNLNLTGSITGEYNAGSRHDHSHIGGIAGRMGHRVLIKNVSSNMSINITVRACSYVGGLVGYSLGTIKNSSATGNITGSAPFECLPRRGAAGVLAGMSDGKIQDSHATGNILFRGEFGKLGGLVGINNSVILRSSATGNVYRKGNSYYSRLGIGGLVGNNYGTIRDSRTGDIANGIKAGDIGSTYPAGSGGLVGRNYATITKSYATGDVYSPTRRYYPTIWRSPYGSIGPFLYNDSTIGRMGGLVGYNADSYIHYMCCTITDSHATGNVYGGSYPDEAGGLVGKSRYALIRGNYATGNVYGNGEEDDLGGLVGYLHYGKMEDNYTTGNVYGGEDNDNVGGLVGYIRNGKMEDNYATGNVYGNLQNDFVGGLVGETLHASIKGNYATGNVYGGKEVDFVGGLVGYIGAGGRTEDNYATGNVYGNEGNDWVGGLTGYNLRGIRNNFATGAVYGNEGRDKVGGLSGGTDTGSIRNSYATGAVYGNEGYDRVGGLAGSMGSGSLTNSYAIGAVDGGSNDSEVGKLIGGRNPQASIAGNYYRTSRLLVNGTELTLTTKEAKAKNKGDLTALTIATTNSDFPDEGWSNFDWNLTDNDKYPSLKSYKAENGTQVEGAIICSQSSEHVQC